MMRLVSPATKLGQSHQIKALPCQHTRYSSRRTSISISRFAYKGDSSQAEEDSKEKQLKQLDDYFKKLNHSISKNERTIGKDKIGIIDSAAKKYNQISNLVADAKRSVLFENTDNRSDVTFLFNEEKFKSVQSESEDSDFCLINLLVAINIAVLLFETASPIRDDDLEYVSLPFFYGAKVNKLILLGEWWRLLTPMFLHSGFFHVVLGCWGLLTFGPRVCRAYGPVTFFLIYLLGGICGNFTSFLHTPELTVCGTGPLFAIIGAWLVYQVQNKEAIPKDVLETMFQRAVLVTVLSFILSFFGPIDNWSHLGATLSGLAFGYFTCPSLELDNADAGSKEGQKEGVALMQRQINPCKSVAIFTVLVILLTSLVYLYGMQLELLEI
ncbi:rhomboid-related intramembrane serine protease family protein [Carex rostrata]